VKKVDAVSNTLISRLLHKGTPGQNDNCYDALRNEAAIRIERLTAERSVLREYYEASQAAWNDVIDVWASDDDGMALHARHGKAERAVEEFDSGKEGK
jgi:hypothetical protein